MYSKIFEYVLSVFQNRDAESTTNFHFPFRKRSEHIERVYNWAKELSEDIGEVDKQSLLIAALFHDIGYAAKDDRPHAVSSSEMCEKYLIEMNYEKEFISKTSYLVANHSKKELLLEKDIPLELVLLMEADLLDETGALSILWDCMIEGSKEIQSFEKAYLHIKEYSGKILSYNPMRTKKAKYLWEQKQLLVRDFIQHLEVDLGKRT